MLQVVIIDEAHNLSDTLSCIHSAELTGAQVNTVISRPCRECRFKRCSFPVKRLTGFFFLQLCRSHSQLAQYADRYKWVHTYTHTHSGSHPALMTFLTPDVSASTGCLYTRSRLKAKNLMYIKQILFVVEGLVRALGGECVQGERNYCVQGTGQTPHSVNVLFAGKVGQNPQSQVTQAGL